MSIIGKIFSSGAGDLVKNVGGVIDNLKIAPKTGRCIVWQNIFLLNILGEPEISYNEDSLHAGLPVINGEKWIATKWIRY